MTRRYYLNDVELTDVNVTGMPRRGPDSGVPGLVSSAFGGDIGMSGIEIDDPTGVVTITGFQRFHVTEDACTPTRVWTGYIGARKISQGILNEGPGVARVWDCDLMDLNFLLGLRAIHGIGTKRPQEYDSQRVAWLLTRAEMTGAGPGIFDLGFVTATQTWLMDESDFLKSYPDNVLSSCLGGPTTYFAYWNAATSQVGLYYGAHSTGFGTLGVRLSNVKADINDTDPATQTTFAAFAGQQIARSPEQVNDGVLYVYRGTPIYRQRASTYTAFGIHRDAVVESDRVGRLASAEAQASIFLDRHATERDTITCTVPLRESQVNWFREGYRIEVKFTHLPGYSTFTSVMIERRNVVPVGFDRYEVHLELTSSAPEGTGPGGGDPGDFPHPPTASPSIVQSISGAGDLVMPSPIAEGDTLVYVGGRRGGVFNVGVAPLNAYTLSANGQTASTGPVDYGGVWYKVAGAAESTSLLMGTAYGPVAGTWYELPGTWTPSQLDADSGTSLTPTSGPITVASGSITFTGSWQGNGGAYDSVAATLTYTPGTGWTEDWDGRVIGPPAGHPTVWTAHRFDSGSITATATNSGNGGLSGSDYVWGMQVVEFVGSAADFPPSPGSWVEETITMTGSSGTTTYPYADGSLTVKVDDYDQTPGVTTFNGAAGTFTATWSVQTGQTVKVRYQGR